MYWIFNTLASKVKFYESIESDRTIFIKFFDVGLGGRNPRCIFNKFKKFGKLKIIKQHKTFIDWVIIFSIEGIEYVFYSNDQAEASIHCETNNDQINSLLKFMRGDARFEEIKGSLTLDQIREQILKDLAG